ncbi:hypothetical protein X947_3405 [Burkholderia pseudomallei MSHR7334]|nr:hypothetical protein X947_3405 [Burkholderia pseudomallei MSHR7334]
MNSQLFKPPYFGASRLLIFPTNFVDESKIDDIVLHAKNIGGQIPIIHRQFQIQKQNHKYFFDGIINQLN